MSAKEQTELVANYIMASVPGEPSQDEAAGACAVRLLDKYRSALWAVIGACHMPGISSAARTAYLVARRALAEDAE